MLGGVYMEEKHPSKMTSSPYKKFSLYSDDDKSKFWWQIEICLYENKFSHLTGIPHS